MIIALSSIKGGPGKSTLAANTAVWLMRNGHNVFLIDGDKQGTTAEWIEDRRESGLYPDLPFTMMTGNCRNDIMTLEQQGFTVVFDCGGHDSIASRSALSAATHVLLPCRPKRRDMKAMPRMADYIEEARIINPDVIVKTVLNQVPALASMTKKVNSAFELCEALGLNPMRNRLLNREVWDHSEEDGGTVLEWEPAAEAEKAVAEFDAVMNEFLGVANER